MENVAVSMERLEIYVRSLGRLMEYAMHTSTNLNIHLMEVIVVRKAVNL